MPNDTEVSPLESGSPLLEADPAALEELWARINDKLIGGMPETLTGDDPDVIAMVARYRGLREKFLTQQNEKLAAGPRARVARKDKPASIAAVVSADDFDV